jgi:catechol 2,3-dioxygenase
MGAQGPLVPRAQAPEPIDPGGRIGHVHLRTADIDRIRGFYVDVLGFDVVFEARDVPGWGTTGDVLFVSARGYHHHLGFNTWKSRDGEPMPDGVTGLHHVAIAYPTRRTLADAYRRLARVDWPIRQAESYPTHDAIYVVDPDGNTLELMWDKPADEWALTPEGHQSVGSFGAHLDLDGLLAELDCVAVDDPPAAGPVDNALPPGGSGSLVRHVAEELQRAAGQADQRSPRP